MTIPKEQFRLTFLSIHLEIFRNQSPPKNSDQEKSGIAGKAKTPQVCRDIIGRVAALIRYGIIRMAEKRRVCERWLAETGLSVGGVCLGAFRKYRDLSSEALAIRSSV